MGRLGPGSGRWWGGGREYGPRNERTWEGESGAAPRSQHGILENGYGSWQGIRGGAWLLEDDKETTEVQEGYTGTGVQEEHGYWRTTRRQEGGGPNIEKQCRIEKQGQIGLSSTNLCSAGCFGTSLSVPVAWVSPGPAGGHR